MRPRLTGRTLRGRITDGFNLHAQGDIVTGYLHQADDAEFRTPYFR